LWLIAAAALSVLAVILSACSSNVAPPAPQVITDKGDPFSNLLVPKLQASVTDGAVGVEVDSPVTVSAGDGVFGAVSMVNEEGEPVAGQLSADASPGRPPSRSATTSSTRCTPRHSDWVGWRATA
jgi:hypothetical protein